MSVHHPASSWAPDEDGATLWLERAMMAGANISFAAYGVTATLYFICFSHLWSELKRRKRSTIWHLVYITTIFSLSSIAAGTNMRFSELAFIDNRDFPGGPAAYSIAENSIFINLLGTGVVFAATWLQDGLLLYRYLVIWGFNLWMLIIPGLLFLVSVIMSCFLLAQLCLPGATLWETSNVNFALVYWSTSVATNWLLTLLIVGKLAYMRHRVRKIMGADQRSPYLSVSTMLIESAALYSTFAIAFMVTYARNDTANFLFFTTLSQVQTIAPLLIVLRVAQGRAWTSQTLKETRSTLASTSRRTAIPLQFSKASGVNTGQTNMKDSFASNTAIGTHGSIDDMFADK
ncbi:hypothetical protein PUNSTDRAFT_75263 [Punctularia strigosozonata HHB-11173 SS5]|uniref:Uncharacterized protein n=1 Tax=Punctularia strigosozonata (strain HHB-11173) TaxID=741275 RepID=R7S5B1_PUNST|nr:uncharacterized protein PUNSTDRAFT_75263 [Punctularia strigosozonata HHB-11173 SS5]EIN05092.1 hypothetical protein PUNSTDRAFT_75263 [Punctularia strigosozonata HHB-11173 SS5]